MRMLKEKRCYIDIRMTVGGREIRWTSDVIIEVNICEEMNVLEYFFFINYLLLIFAYESMKYQRGCDAWQVTAKFAQPCIFLTKSHECTANCAISSRNFSNHYIIKYDVISHVIWIHKGKLKKYFWIFRFYFRSYYTCLMCAVITYISLVHLMHNISLVVPHT